MAIIGSNHECCFDTLFSRESDVRTLTDKSLSWCPKRAALFHPIKRIGSSYNFPPHFCNA